MGERNTAFLLKEWGVWLKQGGGVNLKARSAMQAIYQSVGEEGGYEVAQINDDDAMQVDRAMAMLRLHRPEYFRVLWLVCVDGYSFRAAADSMDISQIAVARNYEGACTWVDFVLNVDVFLSEKGCHKEFLQAA